MKKERISDILENINTKYIDEATLYTGKTQKLRFSAVKWGAVAACLSLALVAAFAIPKLSLSHSENKGNSEQGTEENAYANGEETSSGSESGEIYTGAYIGDGYNEPTSDDIGVSSVKPDYIAMLMVDGKLYKAAGLAFMSANQIEPDGKIVSTCDGVPTENDQSNFGSGYGYQIGENGTVNVRFEDVWHVFALVDSSDTHEEPSEGGQTASSPANAP